MRKKHAKTTNENTKTNRQPLCRGFLSFFQLRGRKYHLRTIPTGGNSPPAAAQAYSEIIARLVKLKFVKIATDVYIGNLRLLAHSREALEDALTYVFEVCLILQVAVNDELDECLKRNFTEYEFLGIVYCHVSRTTKLSEKTRSKLTKVAALMDDPMVSLRTGNLRTSWTTCRRCSGLTAPKPSREFWPGTGAVGQGLRSS